MGGGSLKGIEQVLVVLEDVAKVFEANSQNCFSRANKEHNIKLKRDDLIAGNVWAKAAAHVRNLKMDIPTKRLNENMRLEVLKYHREDE